MLRRDSSCRFSRRISNRLQDVNMSEESELECYRELGLIVNNQQENLISKEGKDMESKDKHELRKIIFKILRYPSIELAQLHRQCNRIGTKDLNIERERNSYAAVSSQDIYCNCCGFRKQPDTISLSVQLQDIQGIGTSTTLLFQSNKGAILFFLLATFFYSILPIAISLIDPTCFNLWCRLSTQTDWHYDYRLMNNRSSSIQAFFGTILVILWGLLFIMMGKWTDYINTSVSDFTIQITQLPSTTTRESLQAILDDYYLQLGNPDFPSFEIVKFNVAEPFYMNKQSLNDPALMALVHQRDDKKNLFRQWIEDRAAAGGHEFQIDQQQRLVHLEQYERISTNIRITQKSLTTKVAQEHIRQQRDMKDHTVFVTFRYIQANDIIAQFNQPSYLDRLRIFLFSGGEEAPRIKLDKAIIIKAPEPEDVIWTNMGISRFEKIKRRLVAFFLNLLMICATFFIVLKLSIFKKNDTKSQIVSFLISIVINLLNAIIGVIIRNIAEWQRHFTKIGYQKSFAWKNIIIQTINLIMPVLLVDLVINKNLSGKGGLAQDVFNLAILNVFASCILKIINLKHLIKSCRRMYLHRPDRRLQVNQKALNGLYEGNEFEAGNEYIFIVKTCLFTSFFLSLVPSISIISMIGLFLTYWVNKFNLLKRSKRPAPGTNILHNALIQLAYLCPLFFAAGALIWPNYESKVSHITNAYNAISCIIGLIFFFFPIEAIASIIFKSITPINNLPLLTYEQSRVMFSTDYDLVNPATKYQAEIQYRQFLKKQIERNRKINAQTRMLERRISRYQQHKAEEEEEPEAQEVATGVGEYLHQVIIEMVEGIQI